MDAFTPLTSGLAVDYALRLGASLAGVARAVQLRCSPSHSSPLPSLGADDQLPRATTGLGRIPDTHSLLVTALAHDPGEPALDYWGVPGGTRGNQVLIGINQEIRGWLEREFATYSRDLPYHPDKGGIYLKDAAVLAGLGCIGKNNLLVTPEFGPFVRLRALVVAAPLESTGPLAFDPCDGCPAPCRRACPRSAFDHAAHDDAAGHRAAPGGLAPARDGCYSRDDCELQMGDDLRAAHGDGSAVAVKPVEYCRLCESSCVLKAR